MKNTLKNYLEELETERFSGFNGYDSFDMGVDGNTTNQSCVAPSRAAKPYSITFNNSTGGAGATFVLFGNNRYSDVTNYGSTVGVVITVSGGITYPELLAQSATKPFVAKRWRFISSDATNISQTVTVTYRDANGRQITDPVSLAIYDDPYQYSSSKVDVDYTLKIDGTAYLSGNLAASTSLQIIVFPEAISDIADMLNNQNVVRTYEAPILSAAIPVRPTRQILPSGNYNKAMYE
jgi:hypothetical protein